MAGGFNRDTDDIVASINVTPLVDIILVLLIVFMLTATFMRDPVIEVQLPKAANVEEAPARVVALTVDTQRNLYINGRRKTRDEVLVELRARLADEPTLTVIVAADGTVAYEAVMGVIDLTREARVQNLALNVRYAPGKETPAR